MQQPSRRQILVGAGAGAALALVGCGSSPGGASVAGKTGAMSNFGTGVQFKATQPLTFSIMMLSNPAYPYKANWPFFRYLKQKTNISLNSTVVPFSDYNSKRSTLINAGQAPMIIPKTYPGEESQYVAGGAILPVSDYVHLMPNFQDKVNKWNLQGDLDTLRQADGKYYLLPGLHQQVWTDYSLAVRTDVLQKLNIPTPGTWDDVHSMLMAMKTANPQIFPLSDRWNQPTPGGAFLMNIGNSYSTAAGWNYQAPGQGAFWEAGSGKYVLTGAMPQYKNMVTFLNTMYKQGLIDPESFTQSDDIAKQKFVSGKSLVISTNAQYLVMDRQAMTVPGATISKIPVPIGPAGPVVVGSRLESGLMISSKAKQSEDFLAMLQFIDWLWYSDAGQLFARWGIPGVTYTGSVANGTFHLAPNVDWAGLNPKAKTELNVTYGFYNGVFAYGGSTALLDTQFTPEELTFQKAMDSRRTLPLPPPAPLTSAEQQQVTLWGTTLMDYVQQQTLQFILGKRPLSQWDQYVSELQSKNGGQLVSTVQNAYKSFKHKFG
ncbi:MAG: extracellular solute-binding protein [Actinobacteria bacterium]|nr:extracellular solute-binding protein [Actinomycetota bacterium]